MYIYVHLRKVGATFSRFIPSKIQGLFSYFTRKCVILLRFTLLYLVLMIITKEYTTNQVADLLGTTSRGVDNLVYRGKISFVKRGGRRKFRETDIEAYLNDYKEVPAFGRRKDD